MSLQSLKRCVTINRRTEFAFLYRVNFQHVVDETAAAAQHASGDEVFDESAQQPAAAAQHASDSGGEVFDETAQQPAAAAQHASGGDDVVAQAQVCHDKYINVQSVKCYSELNF